MKCVPFWPAVICLTLQPLVGHAEESKSALAAKTLCERLTASHLDAVAVRDGKDPGRFIAALLYPNAELLVIAGRYKVPEALQPLVAQKKYHDVYAALQGTQDVSSQVFFIDMKADGLRQGPGEETDVMYESGNKQTVFDETWRKQHGLGDAAYREKFESADRLYASLLDALAGALTEASPN
jgi:hypothetical protein